MNMTEAVNARFGGLQEFVEEWIFDADEDERAAFTVEALDGIEYPVTAEQLTVEEYEGAEGYEDTDMADFIDERFSISKVVGLLDIALFAARVPDYENITYDIIYFDNEAEARAAMAEHQRIYEAKLDDAL